MIKKTGCVLLTALFICVLNCVICFAAPSVPDGVISVQSKRGRCTIASCVQMARLRLANQGEDFSFVTESAMKGPAWSSQGLAHEFSFSGIDFHSRGLSGISMEELQELHNEFGPVVLYSRSGSKQHAVTIVGIEDNVIYCLDPAEYFSGSVIPLDESCMGDYFGSQDGTLSKACRVWLIEEI